MINSTRADLQLIPNVKTSWIGNTWGGGSSWMQDYIDEMVVDSTGRCFTYSGWDEGHNERGEYWYENNEWHVITHGSNDVPRISCRSININGVIWIIDNNGSVNGSNGKIIPNITKATALGVYLPLNYLMVADDGIGQHVVKFYNISSEPTLVKVLGTLGGIGAGIPGVVTPTKFWGLKGCGSDSAGNVYVCISDEGVILKRFAVLNANNLIFDEVNLAEARGLHFMDNADFDPTKDGLEIWGKQEHYIMDYSKPPGKQETLVGYTLDSDKYPNDPRLKNQVSIKVRYKNNVRFLFSFEQNINGVNVYKFNGEIANQFLFINEPVFVDDNCDVWLLGDGIQIMRCMGIDASGNLTYSTKTKYSDFPAPFTKVKQLLYDAEHDMMYLAGGNKEYISQGGAHQGPLICKYRNWSTTKDYVWEVAVPWYHNEAPVFERIVPEAWDLAGERLYIGYVIGDGGPWPHPEHDTPGVLRVYNTKNGEFLGRIFAGPEVFEGASWLDLNNAVNAFERANGEHLIIREEAWKNKNIIFSYFPEGENPTTTIKKVVLNKITSGNFFMNNQTINFDVSTDLSSGSVSKVELYADNQLLNTDSSSPYQFSVTNFPAGKEVTFRAVAYDNNGGKAYSNRIYLKISDGSPDVIITSPVKKTRYLTVDKIPLKTMSVDYDGIITKIEYFANGNKIAESHNVNEIITWNNPIAGNIVITAKVTDNAGKIGISDPVSIIVWDYRNSDLTQNPIQGLRFRYFENEYPNLPNFDAIISNDIGRVKNFLLDAKTREDKFAFRFDGYIKIDTQGLYTFYLKSDDGSKMYLGDDLLINNDGNHSMQEEAGRVLLKPGFYKFIVDYAQSGTDYGLEVRYDGPGISKILIPDNKLFFEESSLICPVPITKIELSKNSITLSERNGAVLSAKVSPDNTCSKKVTWSSSNTSIVEVDSKGNVIAKSAGDATIKAASADPNISAVCNVLVTPNSVPAPWALNDIGLVNAQGTAAYNNGEFTVAGSGGDIFGSYDEFAYLSQNRTGNSSISVRVKSQTPTHEWAKGGVMFRDGTTGSNAFVMLAVTPINGLQFCWRNTEGNWADLTNIDAGKNYNFPVYLKLERINNTFNAYKSQDGNNWILLGSKIFETFSVDARAGLSVTSHNNGSLSICQFDNLNLTGQSIYVPVSGVKVKPENLNIHVTGALTLELTVFPIDATNKKVTWTSSNPSAVSVNSTGRITANTPGNSNITATTVDGKFTSTCNITVYSPTPNPDPDPNPDPTPDPDPNPNPNPDPSLRIPENPVNATSGLDYKYYEGQWNVLPDFATLTPVKIGNSIFFDISSRNKGDNFAFEFIGYLNIISDGQYTLYTTSDDGSKLYIGDQLIVNNDGSHGSIEKSGTIGLKAGKHAIKVVYFQGGGGMELKVSYSGPNIDKQVIPALVLFKAPIVPPAPKYLVTINNGSGSGEYKEGDVVNINADAPSIDMEFNQWNGDNNLLSDIKLSSTSFIMPNKGIILTATYKSKIMPAAKIIKAVSRKTHGIRGNFDIPIAIGKEIIDVPTECRSSTKLQIVVEFDKEVTSGQVVVIPAVGKKASLNSDPTINGKILTINLTSVSDVQLLKISLNNVVSPNSETLLSELLQVKILIGDIDGDGRVTAKDKKIIDDLLLPMTTNENFRSDMNFTGNLTAVDSEITTKRINNKI